MSAPRAFAVVDLGFGDAGKGLATDYLTRREGATLVVRFHGGAQAGHNVVAPDGRHHTFSQLGAGSFVAGVRTHLARGVVVHPTALLVEAEVLERAGVRAPLERVAISGEALVVTPFHQAACRLRELLRGPARHGTTGVGVGEAVRGALEDPTSAVRMADLADAPALERKLARVRERLVEELRAGGVPDDPRVGVERALLEDPDVARTWRERAARVVPCVRSEEQLGRELRAAPCVVFEGAQGLLLDEALGFHPYTTWSDCTATGAQRLLAEHAPGVEPHVLAVLRAHAVRHGPGPLPTEDRRLDGLVAEHNRAHAWQGRVRYGWFDGVLARYALAVSPRVDTLLLTHVDALARRADWRACGSYAGPSVRDGALFTHSAEGQAVDVRVAAPTDLARQARLAEALAACRPVFTQVPADEARHLHAVEELLRRRIDLVSRGPSAADVAARA